MSTIVGVDCRLVAESGIGVSLRGFLQRLIASHPEWQFVLLGDTTTIQKLDWSRQPNVVVEPFRASVYPVLDHWQWWRLCRYRLDLLWIPHFTIPLLSLLWSGRLLVTIHDIAYVAMPEVAGRAKYLYAYVFYKLIRYRADGIFFVSRFSEQEFRSHVGTPRGLTRVIHNGVSPEWLEARRNVVKREGIARPFIVYVGNVKPNKNLRRLITAFGSLIHRIPHDLLIIGRNYGFGTGDEGIEAFAGSLGDRVRFAGAVEDAIVRNSVAQASLLVLPSLYEGFGLPALEAMAAGCPVAAARIASLTEICGDAARYFEPLDVNEMAQTILRTLEDDNLRRDLILKGRERVLQFDWNASGDALGALIVEMLASKPDAKTSN